MPTVWGGILVSAAIGMLVAANLYAWFGRRKDIQVGDCDPLPSPLSSSWVQEQRRQELSKIDYEGPVWKWPVQ